METERAFITEFKYEGETVRDNVERSWERREIEYSSWKLEIWANKWEREWKWTNQRRSSIKPLILITRASKLDWTKLGERKEIDWCSIRLDITSEQVELSGLGETLRVIRCTNTAVPTRDHLKVYLASLAWLLNREKRKAVTSRHVWDCGPLD